MVPKVPAERIDCRAPCGPPRTTEQHEGHVTDHPLDILLVEDNAGDVRLTQEVFKEGKVPSRLHIARDGVEALEILREENGHELPRPDIVLLDLNLPRKDGRDVLAEMKEDEVLRTIPVVVLSTSNDPQDVAFAYGHGASCFVTKPVDLDHFMEVVAAVEDFWLRVVTLPAR
jgi:CheY-like chemotaxis protein